MRNALVMVLAVLAAAVTAVPAGADFTLEPFTYTENFEARLLGAWASYPLWQDTAYDPNFRINTIVPGDPNISVEERVTPYTNVDNYCGAEKLLDMYLVPGSSIKLRYYLKSNLPFDWLKVRIAAGPDGKVDVTFPNPGTNKWVWATVSWDDFARENPRIAGKDRVRVNALALLAKVPKADPAMPFYFGLDDITFKGARAAAFQFSEPQMHKLAEYTAYIPKKHYLKGDSFVLRGAWPVDATRVELTITPYADRMKTVYSGSLKKTGNEWALAPVAISWPENLYLCVLRAFKDDKKVATQLSETPFTMHVAPKGIGGKHPRLWYNAETKPALDARLKSDRFKGVFDGIGQSASSGRSRMPLERLVYDLDQYPDEDWLPTWSESGSKILPTGDTVYWNALAYSLRGDKEAGEYAKNVFLKLADYPTWNHPWQIKRGRWADHRSGAWAHRLATGYDLVYDLMTEPERVKVRKALMDNLVLGAYKSHVMDDNITCATSNWLAMITGGSLMLQAAMWDDGPDVANLEPYFSATAMKLYRFLERVANYGEAWGEGYGYNRYSFENLSRSLPSLMNVFNIDFSNPVKNTWKEYVWCGLIKDKSTFYYGDSNPTLGEASGWAWLLAKNKDPLLGWYYNFLKSGDGIMDVLYETKDVPQKDPFSDNPVKLFREVGSTVFKSGWEKDDFSFELRTGPFYNHQHLDQGTFWLADRGVTFIEERHGSSYYDDPLYQPWYTQPIAHSTILVNGNHQSQRVGDHLVFAEGFDDYAHVTHFLDGAFASFTCGDIGRLYWGTVKGLERDVLFIKPRTLVMLDTAFPAERDADITMLYQTLHLADITAGAKHSTITKEGASLHFLHLAPGKVDVQAVETPHYLSTLGGGGGGRGGAPQARALEKEGMLTVTARTNGVPLVTANLLTSTPAGGTPDATSEAGDGFVAGKTAGLDFAFSTRPGFVYKTGDISTDAVAVAWKGGAIFAAKCTELSRGGKLLVKSATPITCEITGSTVKYYHCTAGEVTLGAAKVNLPAGEGTAAIK